jgi:hypothetical protein
MGGVPRLRVSDSKTQESSSGSLIVRLRSEATRVVVAQHYVRKIEEGFVDTSLPKGEPYKGT